MRLELLLIVLLLFVAPACCSGNLCTFLRCTFPLLFSRYCGVLAVQDRVVCQRVQMQGTGTPNYFDLTIEQRKARADIFYFNVTCVGNELVSLVIYGPNLQMKDNHGVNNGTQFDDQGGTLPFPLDLALVILVVPIFGAPGLKHVEFGDILAPILFPQIYDLPLQLPPLTFSPDVVIFENVPHLTGTFDVLHLGPIALPFLVKEFRVTNAPLIVGNMNSFNVMPNIVKFSLTGCVRFTIQSYWVPPATWNKNLEVLELDEIFVNFDDDIRFTAYSRFPNLRVLSISEGYFPYQPDPLPMFPSLVSLRLSGTFQPLPQWTNQWTRLSLRNSYISGTIPTSMSFSTTEPVVVDLAFNAFSGTLPSVLFNPSVKFQHLDLSYNAFTGSLADYTFNFASTLEPDGFFSVEQNDFGPVPPLLTGAVQSANFARNKFQLPLRQDPKPYQLPSETIRMIDFSGNKLTQVPLQFFGRSYKQLKYLYLQDNQIADAFNLVTTETFLNFRDQDFAYFLFGAPRDINASAVNTSTFQLPVHDNFASGLIDISNNFIEGAYPFKFYSPQFLSNISLQIEFHYRVRMQYNRMKLMPRYLPLPHVLAKRNVVELNEIYIDSFNSPQDSNECTEMTHECDHFCSDGWLPLLSYTCGCDDGFQTYAVTTTDSNVSSMREYLPLRCQASTCGDGFSVGPPFAEQECDTGVIQDPGCRACKIQTGFNCTAMRGCVVTHTSYSNTSVSAVFLKSRKGQGTEVCTGWTCAPICRDSFVVAGEDCEPAVHGKACRADCTVNFGYTCCPKSPSGLLDCRLLQNKTFFPAIEIGCEEVCGDGVVVGSETCDPGNSTLLGCKDCRDDFGYKCTGRACTPICHDGTENDCYVFPPEECDNGGNASFLNPGCTSTCSTAVGYICTIALIGNSSTVIIGGNALVYKSVACNPDCGDGRVVPGEDCDGGRTSDLIGCQPNCRKAVGFDCINNICTPHCGDGLIVAGEDCEPIYNGTNIPGCSPLCKQILGYQCNPATGACPAICGDGRVVPGEDCDILPPNPSIGCSSCKALPGFNCSGGTCIPVCGDRIFVPGFKSIETCEPSDNTQYNGCGLDCQPYQGFYCDNGLCLPQCGDGYLVATEVCEPSMTIGCAPNCSALKGYQCGVEEREKCKNICGDGIVVDPEMCEFKLTIGCDPSTCLPLDGYRCDPNAGKCKSICGDGKLVSPELCEVATNGRFPIGCSSDCSNLTGFDCSSGTCKARCGDAMVVEGEGCDTGAIVDPGCRDCSVMLGYFCPLPQNGQAVPCVPCPRRDTYPEYPKPDFPFPSLQKYYAQGLLNETSLYSCSACDNGVAFYFSSYDRTVATCSTWNTDPAVHSEPCDFACGNQTSITDSTAALVFLHSQFSKNVLKRSGQTQFLAEILHALFPNLDINITASLKRADPMFSVALSDCSATGQQAKDVIRGMISDIIPSAPLSIANDSLRTNAAKENSMPIIIGIVCGLIAVALVVLLVALYIYYARHILHQLPPEVNWSYLHRVTHPWAWQSKDGYYVREYAASSPEWARVMQLVDGFFQCNRALDFANIYAVYNPGLIRGFVTQFNILTTRKKLGGDIFFQHSFHFKKHPKKVWVNEQFESRVNSLEWNQRLPVPILPSVHGTDFFVAEKIAETGFALLSSLDAGYYGKGIYFTSYMLYVLPYACGKRTPAVIVSYLIPGHTYPTTENWKGKHTLLGQALKNGYNSHYVITGRNGHVLKQSLPENKEPGNFCDEIVVGQESQICPAFILKISDNERLQRTLDTWNREVDASEEKMKIRNRIVDTSGVTVHMPLRDSTSQMTSSYQSEVDFDGSGSLGVGLSSSISNLDISQFIGNIVSTHGREEPREEDADKYYQLV